MNTNVLEELALLIRQRNLIDEQIAAVIGRPALTKHLREFIAAQLFDIKLESSASAKGYDGISD